MANVYTNDLVFISVLLAFIYLNKVVSTTQRKKKKEKKRPDEEISCPVLLFELIYIF